MGLVAASVGLLLLFGSDIKWFLSDRLDPRISFQQGRRRGAQAGEVPNKQLTSPVIFDGEVYRTEGRLREASAGARTDPLLPWRLRHVRSARIGVRTGAGKKPGHQPFPQPVYAPPESSLQFHRTLRCTNVPLAVWLLGY